MTLKEKITADLTVAMKTKDELKLSSLRMLKAEIMKYEVSAKDMVETDEVIVDLIKKAIKQRKEAAEGFEKGGKKDMAEKELAEVKIYEAYMPEQMSEEQVKVVVQEVIAQLKPAGPQDFGKVMGAIMGKVKGKADGGVVNKVVKSLLG